MRINGLKFRNAFAYGNEWKHVPFGELNGINLISGDNGWGKTTVSKLLKIGAYFEYDGVPVGEIANEINGNCEIIIDGFSRGHNWEIHSKYSNSRLTEVIIKKEGVVLDTGKPKDTIDWVYREILTVPYPIFANLVNLSVTDFKSLLSLDAKSSRAIRDKLFSIEILNDVKGQLKNENKQVTDETETMTIELETLVKSLADLDSQIKEENARFLLISENQITGMNEDINNKYLRRHTLETDRASAVLEIEKLDKHIKWQKKKVLQDEQTLDQTETDSLNASIADVVGKMNTIREAQAKLVTDNIYYSNTKLDEQISANINEIARLRSTITGVLILETKVRDLQQELSDLVTKNDRNIQIDYLVTKVNEGIESIKAIGGKQAKHAIFAGRQPKLAAFKDARSKRLADLTAEIKQINKNITSIEKGTCSECGTNFMDDNHQNKLAAKIVERDRLTTEVFNITKKNDQITYITNTINFYADHYRVDNDKAALMKVLNTLKANQLFIELVQLTQVNYAALTQAVTTLTAAKTEVKDSQTISTELADIQKQLRTADEENTKIERQINELTSTNRILENQKGQLPEGYKPKHKEEAIQEAKTKLANLETQGNDKLTQLSVRLAQVTTNMNIRTGSLSSLADVVEVNLDIQNPQEVLSQLIQDKQAREDEIAELSRSTSGIEQEVQRLTSEHNGKLKSLGEFKVSQEAKKEALEGQIEKTIEAGRLNLYLEELLSEDNFKRYCISTIIPALNHSIKQISNEFNFPIKCEFDDDFQPKISRYGKQCSLKSISMGQRRILDVVVVLSVTSLISAKYPEINCVFYDEVFSNLSALNTSMMLDQIKKVCCQKHGLTVILANHAFISQDYFDNIIEVTNDGTFSDLKIRRLNEVVQYTPVAVVPEKKTTKKAAKTGDNGKYATTS